MFPQLQPVSFAAGEMEESDLSHEHPFHPGAPTSQRCAPEGFDGHDRVHEVVPILGSAIRPLLGTLACDGLREKAEAEAMGAEKHHWRIGARGTSSEN